MTEPVRLNDHLSRVRYHPLEDQDSAVAERANRSCFELLKGRVRPICSALGAAACLVTTAVVGVPNWAKGLLMGGAGALTQHTFALIATSEKQLRQFEMVNELALGMGTLFDLSGLTHNHLPPLVVEMALLATVFCAGSILYIQVHRSKRAGWVFRVETKALPNAQGEVLRTIQIPPQIDMTIKLSVAGGCAVGSFFVPSPYDHLLRLVALNGAGRNIAGKLLGKGLERLVLRYDPKGEGSWVNVVEVVFHTVSALFLPFNFILWGKPESPAVIVQTHVVSGVIGTLDGAVAQPIENRLQNVARLPELDRFDSDSPASRIASVGLRVFFGASFIAAGLWQILDPGALPDTISKVAFGLGVGSAVATLGFAQKVLEKWKQGERVLWLDEGMKRLFILPEIAGVDPWVVAWAMQMLMSMNVSGSRKNPGIAIVYWITYGVELGVAVSQAGAPIYYRRFPRMFFSTAIPSTMKYVGLI